MRKSSRRKSAIRFTRNRATKRAKRAMELAAFQAQRLRHDYIGTEHLLLGLLEEGDGVAAAVLEQLTGDLAAVRAALETAMPPGNTDIDPDDLNLTPRAERAILLSEEESIALGHHYIGTEHLLLGLVREGDGIAARVLKSLGVDYDGTRMGVIRALSGAGAAEPSATKGHVITCRVDARDLDAIDVLVEAGVRSTRSDAAAWLIHAGIGSNREIFDRVYGTVAEIRRLRQEVAQAVGSDVSSPTNMAPE